MIFRKTIRFLDRITDLAAFIVCIIIFLIGLYSVYDGYMMYKEASDDSVLKYKPGYEGEIKEDDKKILSSMVAWLTIDDTTIDFPVMQGEDNLEFLNKNPFGEYSLSGSIFLDYRNSPDFSDKYNLIYGHHMEEGAFFGALDSFEDEEYLNNHRTGSLTVGKKVYEIELFAFFHADATENAVFSPTENENDILTYVELNGEVLIEDCMPDENDKLIALSTCRYPETTERTIVIGVLK